MSKYKLKAQYKDFAGTIKVLNPETKFGRRKTKTIDFKDLAANPDFYIAKYSTLEKYFETTADAKTVSVKKEDKK